jgi:Putative transposase
MVTLSASGVSAATRSSSSSKLTPHLHLLVAEALWKDDGTLVPVAPPGDEEVAHILARVLREAKKDWADLEAAWPEDEYEALQQRAIQERLGFLEAPASRQRARRLAVLHGFSLHADTAVHGHDRQGLRGSERGQQGLERLCRYGARGPIAECRLRRLDDGRYEYSPKKGACFTVTAAALVRRLVALLPPARLHLTSFHGGYAPNARLRPHITQALPPAPPSPPPPKEGPAPRKPKRPRLDWAQLHQRTFGTDVLRCPCGGRRTITSFHSTRKQAEARLVELGVALPSRVLPPATAPPQLLLAM